MGEIVLQFDLKITCVTAGVSHEPCAGWPVRTRAVAVAGHEPLTK